MPEQKNFYKELAIYQQNQDLMYGEFVFYYGDPFEIINNIMMVTPPKFVRVKRGSDYLIDTDSFEESFVESVKSHIQST